MSKNPVVFEISEKHIKKFYKTYLNELERQVSSPSMKKYLSKVFVYKDDTFVSAFAEFMQDRKVDILEGRRQTLGNYMRDFVTKYKFNYSLKQAQALEKGLKNIESFSEEYNEELQVEIENILKNYNKKTKGLKYAEKVNAIRSDLFNILNEDVGALSSINDTLKKMGEEAQQQLDIISDEYGYLDESDPEIKKLLDMAEYQDSYTRSSFIGNRLFGSPK